MKNVIKSIDYNSLLLYLNLLRSVRFEIRLLEVLFIAQLMEMVSYALIYSYIADKNLFIIGKPHLLIIVFKCMYLAKIVFRLSKIRKHVPFQNALS